MLAGCGVADVLLAYNPVGPNCGRVARLARAYPACRFAVTADHAAAVEALSKALEAEKQSVDVLLDLDVGQHRTGVAPGPEAAALYEHIGRLPGLRLGGLHVYDGHHHQENFVERQTFAQLAVQPALALRGPWKRRVSRSPASFSAARRPSRYMRSSTCRDWSCRRAPVSCTTRAIPTDSPTCPVSRRPPCC